MHNNERKPLGSPLGPFFVTEKDLISTHISNFIGEPFLDEDFQDLINYRSINVRYRKGKILCLSLLRGNHEGSGFNAVAKVFDIGQAPSTTIYSIHFRPIPGMFSLPPDTLSDAELVARYFDSEGKPVYPVGGGYLVSFDTKDTAEFYMRRFVLRDAMQYREFTKNLEHGVVFGIRKPYPTPPSSTEEPIQLVAIEAVQVTKEERKSVPYEA